MKRVILGFLLIFSFSKSIAKSDSIVNPQVRYSPTMICNLLTSNNKYIKITYGQPFKKGRVIFGELIPYGEVWRTGANEATEINFSCPFKIGDRRFESGTYTLFTLPRADSWDIILNARLGQWGAFTYDPGQNLHQFPAKPVINTNIYEGFTIEMFETKKDEIEIKLLWDNVSVPFRVELLKENESHTPKAGLIKKKKFLGIFTRK
ncbi:DUF2911 domain-containing protein [Emticicia sp. CRIBPO]|uniref:DUF2911 domain-containing protein n=1 Tax=Emticicia sp. CRIBPO TaxID=2683258 RepID=UPI001411D4D3|nr:DUF2911 domain-containing protein [Emticicia sp. CRIBPO]NBA87550.1 DUF2911 domain-containing protein [Emticicia sp. CRIBPO]